MTDFVRCPKCKAYVDSDAEVCSDCGRPMDGSQAPASAASSDHDESTPDGLGCGGCLVVAVLLSLGGLFLLGGLYSLAEGRPFEGLTIWVIGALLARAGISLSKSPAAWTELKPPAGEGRESDLCGFCRPPGHEDRPHTRVDGGCAYCECPKRP